MSKESIVGKSCAHPRCACQAEKGKEFCSDACRNATVPTGGCRCGHEACGIKGELHSSS